MARLKYEEDSLLALLAYGLQYAVEEGCHQLRGLRVASLAHHRLAPFTLCPVGRYGGFVASEVDVWRGEQGGQFAYHIGQQGEENIDFI